jgi:thioredoxin 1
MAGGQAVEITDSNFEDMVLNSNKPVLVDFWAEWCGPCKALAPAIEELATDYDGRAVIGKLNVDENASTTSQCGVSAFPTLLIYKDGEVKERIVGLRSKKDLADSLDRVLG